LGKSSSTIQKREKEKARAQHRMDKEARKADAKERRAQREVVAGEDPDIAHIVPGPQPLPPELGGGEIK
jgi:hypothetical protein